MKAWLKGGLIGGFVGIILLSISMFFEISADSKIYGINFLDGKFLLSLLGILLMSIPFIILGMIISKIYYKIKSKDTSLILKFGLIGFLLLSSLIWISMIPTCRFSSSSGIACRCNAIGDGVGCNFVEFIIWPIHLIIGFITGLVGLIIGALIGWIIGKVKQRRNQNLQNLPVTSNKTTN